MYSIVVCNQDRVMMAQVHTILLWLRIDIHCKLYVVTIDRNLLLIDNQTILNDTTSVSQCKKKMPLFML